jgi:hypothetical protein
LAPVSSQLMLGNARVETCALCGQPQRRSFQSTLGEYHMTGGVAGREGERGRGDGR